MKVLISPGPIIGVIVISVYSQYMRVRLYNIACENSELLKNKYHKLYFVLIFIEIVLVLMSIFLPKITGESYLLDDMTSGGRYIISPTKFVVAYKESNRNYSNRIKISEEALTDIRAVCSSDEGSVFLVITQGDIERTVDISNEDILLDMSTFEEGTIRFTLKNENAKNVKFELIW